MSLDISLVQSGAPVHSGSGIFVRENGQTKEISREEWDEKFPGREPVLIPGGMENDSVFSANITHNLGGMAEKADLYAPIWTPEEWGAKKAADLIHELTKGLTRLKRKPAYFKRFNPSNGWGNYEVLVDFVEEYLEACKKYPDAKIEASR